MRTQRNLEQNTFIRDHISYCQTQAAMPIQQLTFDVLHNPRHPHFKGRI